MSSAVTAAGFKSISKNGGEFALLDIRKPEDFQAGHLLLSVNIPVAKLSHTVRQLVPRLGTQIVLYDGETGQAGPAVTMLEKMGYGDLHIAQGDVSNWVAQGFQMFQGTYTINNAFAVAAERFYGTPRMTAETLQAKLADGEDIYIIDSRPFDEFHAASIPGAHNIPVVELIRHIEALEQDPAADIVVTCGGRARAIFGAQSLINAGIEKPVHALYYGTMGWDLAGFPRTHGSNAVVVPDHPHNRFHHRADNLTQRITVRTIEPEILETWLADRDRLTDKDGRTLYLIDVRTREEFDAGHIPGSRWVPGGELVGLTEDHMATRNARLCLVDNDGGGDTTRATLTASWMLQMGWSQAVVLEGGVAAWQASELEHNEHTPEFDPAGPGNQAPSRIPPSGPLVSGAYQQIIEYREQLPEQIEKDASLTFRFPPIIHGGGKNEPS
ncbi:MAG: hypothetical protein H8E30_19730 [Alphaproteobacteria bacterium]|nr:hypothetical protein [Alphaproteobacteria bacterium]